MSITAVGDPAKTCPAGTEDSDPSADELAARVEADPPRRRREPEPEPALTRLGRYVILRELGRGAIGVVYAAYHEGLDRKLAIKVLNRQRAGRADLEARLQREARALAKLSHPNVVHVYDVGKFEGRVFVAMEFVEGETLGSWMRRDHPLEAILRMFADAGRGLAAAHEAGVIHRDFKPENVIVGEDDERPRVLDFGLARAIADDEDRPRALPRAGSKPNRGALDSLFNTAAALLGSRTEAREELEGKTGAAPADDPEATRPIATHDPDATETRLGPPPDPEATAEARGPRPIDPDATVDAPNPPSFDPEVTHTRPGPPSPLASELDPDATLDVPDLDETASLDTLAPASAPDDEAIEATATLHDSGRGTGGAGAALSAVETAAFEGDVLTRTGALMGTPAYMAPEQFLAAKVTHLSDQFSFCVALYEAVYGRRPFAGKSTMELAYATQQGKVADPPAHSEVPGWLHALILRGLAPKPEDRWPSMAELVAELERDPGAQRRRRWALGLGFVGAAALSLIVAALIPEREPPCAGLELEGLSSELLGDDRRRSLAAAFTGSGLPYAATSWTNTEARLRRWSEAWAGERVEACEATHLRHEFSAEILDLRNACLDRQRRAYEALIAQLAEADPTVIEHAVEAAVALPEPARCGDTEALLHGVASPPTEVADAVEALRDRLVEIDSLLATGRWRQGLARSKAAVAAARDTGYAPVIAEALLLHGRFLVQARDDEGALAALQEALDAAERSGHDELVPRVAIELVALSIYTRPDPIRGRLWARRAMAALDRVDAQGFLRARGIAALGNLERVDGAYTVAEAHLREAIEILDRSHEDHPHRAIMLNDLGNALFDRGERDEARAVYERALAESRAAFGDGHPQVGHTRFNLGRLATAEGETEQAREQLQAAREIYAAALGPEHLTVGSVAIARAALEASEGELDRAREHALLARRIYERELGEDNLDRAEPSLSLGNIAAAKAELDEALEHYERGLAIQEAALPEGHIAMATTHANIGLVHLRRGEADDAVAALERAVDLLEAGAGVDPEELRMYRLYLGDALMMRAQATDAHRAATVFAAARAANPETLAKRLAGELALRQAKAHAAAGEHERTAEVAGEARALFAELDDVDSKLAEIDALLP